jgi:hypothetical protein
MACCMAALLFVYQLIHAWQRFRRWCGWPARAAGRAQTWLSVQLAAVSAPLPKTVWIVVMAFELGVGSGLLYAHREHLHQAKALISASTFAAVQRLCSTPSENL